MAHHRCFGIERGDLLQRGCHFDAGRVDFAAFRPAMADGPPVQRRCAGSVDPETSDNGRKCTTPVALDRRSNNGSLRAGTEARSAGRCHRLPDHRAVFASDWNRALAASEANRKRSPSASVSHPQSPGATFSAKTPTRLRSAVGTVTCTPKRKLKLSLDIVSAPRAEPE